MIKVVFVVPSLHAGGAERIMSSLPRLLNHNKFRSTLLVIGYQKDAAYDLTGVDCIFLNEPRVLTSIPKLILQLLKLKPDRVLSSLGYLNTVLGLLKPIFPKIKFIGREVNVSKVLEQFPEKTTKRYPKFLTNWGYKGLYKIICQSDDMYHDFRDYVGVDEKKLVIINNPITSKIDPKENQFKRTPIRFITIGSLEPRKGHDRILRCLSKFPFDFHYTIIGNGHLKEIILSQCDELGLKSKITHIPFTNNVYKYLKENDFFLQGSYVEGFPNALLESLACGTPALVYEAPGGINEIILGGLNGYIAKDEVDFLDKLQGLNKVDWCPDKISESVYSRYSAEIIIQKYEQLLSS